METEEERQIRRKKRIEEMKKEKRKAELLQTWGIPAVSLAVLAAVGIWLGPAVFSPKGGNGENQEGGLDGSQGVTIQDIVSDEPHGAGGDTGDPGEAGRQDKGNSGTVSDFGAESGEGSIAVSRGRKGNRMDSPVFSEGTETIPISGPAEIAGGEGDLTSAVPAGKTPFFEAHDSENTMGFDETIISQYGVLIDVEDGIVLAQKGAHERMNPASMTKILTLLVAAEHLTEEDLEATVQITIEITDYCFVNECSVTGYELDEVVPVKDLLYGTILPSGADSSLALANYVAGSQEAFVELMNEKVAELGLAENTHFTNCVGLYDEAHYTTAYDMAVILKAAADNAFCREILSARTYVTTATEEHPEGLVISNWFLRRIEDKDTHGEVLCGKTGFVDQSGSCAASLAVGNNGREYLCVTANSTSSGNCIADQVALYQKFIPE